MKNKKILIIIISILVILLAYFGYKGFNLYYYNFTNNDSYNEVIKGLNIDDSINISETKLGEDEYLTYENVKIKNIFQDFEKAEQNIQTSDSIKYLLKDHDKVIASFWISKGDTYLTYLESKKDIYTTNNRKISNEEIQTLLEKNNINNDLDLFEYLKNDKSDLNIFTTVKEMRRQYNLKYFVSTMLPEVTSITRINGRYDGYIFNLDFGWKEVNIIKNNKRYSFTFMGKDYFKDSDVVSLLNTIEIEDE